MSLFYNPKTKKAKPWVFITFIAIPIIVIVISLIIAQSISKKDKRETAKIKEIDIFSQP